MTQVLYRKYRPTNFDEVIGQDHVKLVLQQQIKKGEISHAYLFAGPRGTGKTTIARLFAGEINKDGNELSVIEIDAASNRGIDEIRDLKEKINFLPSNSKYKVYIIDEVHMLTKEAFNAILKTLEEPPSHVIFLFATTEPHKVPATILSRVLRFDFELGTNEHLNKKIEKILKSEKVKFENEAVELIVKAGKGSYRDSESILEKVIGGLADNRLTRQHVEKVLGFIDNEVVNQFIAYLSRKDLEKAITVLDSIKENGYNVEQFMMQALERTRDILYAIIKDKDSSITLKFIGKIIKELSEALNNSKTSSFPELSYEIALINICEENAEVNMSMPMVKSKSVKNNILEYRDNNTKQIIEKQTVEKKDNNVQVSISIEDIDKIWPELIIRMKKYNHHLTAFLVKAKPNSIVNGNLELHVPFEFHKKRLSETNAQKVILKELSLLLTVEIGLVIKVDDTLIVMGTDAEKSSGIDSNEGLVEEIFS